ncbi:putative sulfate exporter family transporter [Pelagibius sp. CAU 1746]|uniref:YeiH family protein n=1 Tax=Pelagibius sp. CAU 1746 TaxID=3140370 RepID=UPI00325B361A
MSPTDLSTNVSVSDPQSSPSRPSWQAAGNFLAGILIAAGIAATAFALHLLPVMDRLSPLILAVTIGIVFGNTIGVPGFARAGVTFSMRTLLRVAIVCLGAQITLPQLLSIGAGGVIVTVATLLATFFITIALGRALGVERKLTQLIAAGTAICGASAIVATSTTTRASEEDTAYAIACVTLFGTVAMLCYPLVLPLLGLGLDHYGLWVGASIHEIAQVAAAAFQVSSDVGEHSMIVKLLRVLLLVPLILCLSMSEARRRDGTAPSAGRQPFPWFLLGFAAVVGLNSFGVIPADAKSWITSASSLLLTMALAAMGLAANVRKLADKGIRPLVLGGASSLSIAGFSLLLILAFLN